LNRQEQLEVLLDHYENPRHWGRLAGADLVLTGSNPSCGDEITIDVKLGHAPGGDRVAAMAFVGRGCTVSIAAASVLMEHVTGRPVAQIVAMTYEDMIPLLGEETVMNRPRCVTLALDTLRAGLRNYSRH